MSTETATASIEANNLFSVKGLVAVVTGGGSGIGLMMARALAINGAHKVYIIGRRQDVLQKAAESVATGSIIPLVGDVTSKESLLSLALTIEKDVGYINVLIANSGISGPAPNISKDMTLEEFQKEMWKTDFADYVNTFAVNTAGVWYTIIAFLGLLDKGNKKGNIKQQSQVITTSSIGGFNRSPLGGYPYGQTKAAVTHMTKQLATGLVPYGIRANVICPGLFPSEMTEPVLAKMSCNYNKGLFPAERIGTEEDMAGVILYLTSHAGGYCNGSVMVMDGGRLGVMPSTF